MEKSVIIEEGEVFCKKMLLLHYRTSLQCQHSGTARGKAVTFAPLEHLRMEGIVLGGIHQHQGELPFYYGPPTRSEGADKFDVSLL